MKRVVFLTSVHPYNDIRIFHKEARTLVQAGYRVTILNAERDGEEDGVSFVCVPVPEKRVSRFAVAWWRYAAAALRLVPDICHFHDPELIPAGLWLHSRGIPVVYDSHEDLPRQLQDKPWIPGYLRGGISGVAAMTERLAAAKFDLIIGATELVSRRFSKVNPNVITLHNYPVLAEFPRAEQQRGRAVCYVGAISHSRGALQLVGAAKLAGVPLYLAGQIETPRLALQISRLNFGGNTTCLGVLGRQKIAQLLIDCCAGLVTLHPTAAYMQAVPTKMLEYMAAGLPVIASDFPYWRRLLRGIDCALYVNPLSTQEIANAILQLVDNPEQAYQLGQNGRRGAEQYFCWEREREILLDAYRKLGR